MGIIIRELAPEDAASFLQMLKELDSETKYMLFEPGERKTTVEGMKKGINKMAKEGSVTFAAEVDGKIIGFLSAQRGNVKRNRHSVYLVMGILKDYRGRKIGTKLFEMLEQWAEKAGITRLELTVMTHNDSAIGLYKKFGFKIEGLKEKSLFVDGAYVDEYYMAKIK